jgi:hypothetical protein
MDKKWNVARCGVYHLSNNSGERKATAYLHGNLDREFLRPNEYVESI